MRPFLPRWRTSGSARGIRLRLDDLEARCVPANGWADLPTLPASESLAYLHPEQARPLRITLADLTPTLATAPTVAERDAGSPTVELTLPAPDGTNQRFALWQSAVMAPALAAQFPTIRTYQGIGLDDPTANLRLDTTPQGLHVQVLAPHGSWYIDPYFHLETDTYISYQRTALEFDDVYPSAMTAAVRERTLADPETPTEGHDQQASFASSGGGGSSAARSGAVLRTYRLAVAATGEYTQFHGGTVELGQAAIVTAINRLNAIYERELSIRLQLIANNASLVYTNSTADPFSNGSSSTMLTQNQTLLDGAIGSANYDLGHVFGTAGGGIAGLGVVGLNGSKARGVTAISSPVGDAFYVDYLAHEIGHQFGAEHSFNTSSNGNRVAGSAYEPGSGSTIMGYAGITGLNSDLQPHADPHFHSGSFDEIIEYVDHVIPSVGTRTTTGNAVPTVDAGPNDVIPARTPFVLTATGNDADGDPLTYAWEQRDLGTGQLLTSADNGTSPLFRAFSPTTEASRTFPRLTDLVNNVNTAPLGEKLPTVNRTAMKFRVTVRDNQADGGAVNTDDMQVQVVDTGRPFAVTSPNTVETWLVGEQRTITWDVAGTNVAPISAANVTLTLSLDGGLTYPITLASSVPNTGSATITVPNQLTSMARVRVQGTGHIFFDISNVNFTIANSLAPSQISGRIFEDWNGNGTFDRLDRGLANHVVLVDRNNNGQQDTQTFTSGALNVGIPDADLTGITRTITVAGLPTSLADVNVMVNVTHARLGDLRLYLISPTNVKLPLALNRGLSVNSFQNTVFDDEASTPIANGTGTFSGSFVPDSYLGLLDGSNPNGPWSLQVVDISNSRTGTLVNWSLIFPTELTATTATDGTYRVQGLATGAYRVSPLGSGYNTVAPASGFHNVNLASTSDSMTNRDFARSLQNAIYGHVVFDANLNGAYDTSDSGFANVPIYRDQNNDGQFNHGEPQAISDALGRYVLTNQPSGPANLRVALAGLQTLTFPTSGVLTVNLPANGTLFNNHVGLSIGSPPAITSSGGGEQATVELLEGLTTVTTVTASDADPNTTLTFTLAGGDDASAFTIDPATGELQFVTAPYTALPSDANGDNQYHVTVQVSDGLFADMQELTVIVQASPNRSPTISGGTIALTPIPRGSTTSVGDLAALLFADRVFDPDYQAVAGVAIVGTTAGTWQYSRDGGTTWLPFLVAETAALLLLPTDRVRLVPAPNFLGRATITYRAWDQSTGNAGTYVDLSMNGATGGSTAYSSTTATAELQVARTLPAINEDVSSPTGQRIAVLVQSFTDSDPQAKSGIAVVGASDPALGVWQYSADGRTWRTLPTVSMEQAFLLTANDRLRLRPRTNQFGTSRLTFHAWDQTTGRRATPVNLSLPTARGGNSAYSELADAVFAVVNPVNDRPRLDVGGEALLTRVAPNETEPSGDTVAQILAAHATDVDNPSLGMAITAMNGTANGEWQYKSVSGEWQPFPTVNVRQALLLRPADEVRYRPFTGFTGDASFIFRAWDQTESTPDTTRGLAFSTARQHATVHVANASLVNRAPTLNTSAALNFTPIAEDSRSAGDRIAQLLEGAIVGDLDTPAVQGLAVVGLTGTDAGRWQWSRDRRTWQTMTDVSMSQALLLSDREWLRYVPNANEVGSATMTFHAWDRSRGTVGQRADLSPATNLGDHRAFSVDHTTATVNITPRNDAPELDNTGHPVLPPPENLDPAGTLVATLIQPLSRDIDADALQGIAVIGHRADFGSWQYRLEGESTWQTFPVVSEQAALVLRSTDTIRVLPNPSTSGLAVLRFRAWDQTYGGAGERVAISLANAFSRASETALMAYQNGNNRPLLNTTLAPTLPPNEARTVASIIGGTITDPDANAFQGIALIGATTTLGTWQFSTDGGSTWQTTEPLSRLHALLLRPNDWLRFTPTASTGLARLIYLAWDQTTDQAGTYRPVNMSAVSLAAETLMVHLNAAPVRTA